jgi:spermidine/putrescine transport system permease protein
VPHKFRGSTGIGPLLVLPLTTPEVVLVSLLSLFLDLNVRMGFTTIVIAHIMFSVSYVALSGPARIRGSTGPSRKRRWTWAPCRCA